MSTNRNRSARQFGRRVYSYSEFTTRRKISRGTNFLPPGGRESRPKRGDRHVPRQYSLSPPRHVRFHLDHMPYNKYTLLLFIYLHPLEYIRTRTAADSHLLRARAPAERERNLETRDRVTRRTRLEMRFTKTWKKKNEKRFFLFLKKTFIIYLRRAR